MLAVSVQPTPFKWTLMVVPAGPEDVSRATADGVRMNAVSPTVFPKIRAVMACGPPRSSGTFTLSDSAPASSTTAFDSAELESAHPSPDTRLPTVLDQVNSTVCPGGNPRPRMRNGVPTGPDAMSVQIPGPDP